MGRRWIVAVIVVLAFVGAGVAAALMTSDDTNHRASPAKSSTTVATSTTPSTTAPASTSTSAPAPTTTTAPPVTGTAPGPCGVDTGPIRAAIDAGIEGAQSGADMAECRLAASDVSWAAVRLTAKPGASFTPVTVILHGGAGSWEIVATGGVDAGCGKAPQQVIADLGQFCVGGGGSSQ